MLWRLIHAEGAYVFVCGDGKRMAQDVKKALVEIFVEHGGMDEQRARAYLDEPKSPSMRRFTGGAWC